MANEVKWKAPISRTSGISSATVTTVNGFEGSEIDNEVNLDRWCNIMVSITYGTSPTVDRAFKVYILYDLTSANYEDGSATVEPRVSPVGVYPVLSVTTLQEWTLRGIPLQPFAFKILVWNDTDQTITSNCTVLCETFNEEIQ